MRGYEDSDFDFWNPFFIEWHPSDAGAACELTCDAGFGCAYTGEHGGARAVCARCPEGSASTVNSSWCWSCDFANDVWTNVVKKVLHPTSDGSHCTVTWEQYNVLVLVGWFIVAFFWTVSLIYVIKLCVAKESALHRALRVGDYVRAAKRFDALVTTFSPAHARARMCKDGFDGKTPLQLVLTKAGARADGAGLRRRERDFVRGSLHELRAARSVRSASGQLQLSLLSLEGGDDGGGGELADATYEVPAGRSSLQQMKRRAARCRARVGCGAIRAATVKSERARLALADAMLHERIVCSAGDPPRRRHRLARVEACSAAWRRGNCTRVRCDARGEAAAEVDGRARGRGRDGASACCRAACTTKGMLFVFPLLCTFYGAYLGLWGGSVAGAMLDVYFAEQGEFFCLLVYSFAHFVLFLLTIVFVVL